MRTREHGATPRVAVYARFSSDMQHAVSIERQVQTCREYAKREGWGTIPAAHVYADEAVSGSRSDRAAYSRLLQEIAASNGTPVYDIVLVEDWSRLSRDMQEASKLVKMAPIWGLRVIGCNDGVDTSRKGTKVLTYMKAAMAENFLDELIDRVRGGLRERFRAGHHAGGTIYGYKTVPLLDASGFKDRFGNPRVLGRRLEIVPAQAQVIQRIFREAAAGATPREIAARLDADRVPKPCLTRADGTPYHFETPAGKARQTSRWNPSTVHHLLRAERYTGRWSWLRRTGVGKDAKNRTILRPSPDDRLTDERPDLRIIDEATWEKVQAHLARRAEGVHFDPRTGKLRGRKPGAPPTRDAGNPWRGLLFCGTCGGPIAVVRTPKGATWKGRYLGCVQHFRLKDGCTETGTMRLEELNAALRGALEGYFSDTKLATQRAKKFFDALNAYNAKRHLVVAKVEAEVKKADQALKRITQAIAGGMDGSSMRAAYQEWERKKADAERRLADLAARQTEPLAIKPPAEILALLQKEYLADQRAAYAQLVRKVTLKGTRAPGRRRGTRWTATITPNPTAGIRGLPSVAFGADLFGSSGLTMRRVKPTTARAVRRTGGSWPIGPSHAF